MHKLLPLLPLIVTTSISVGRPAAAEWRLAGPLSDRFATDMGTDATFVLVGGKGGGMSGGGTTGGMGGGTTTGGMGGSTTTGGMESGTTTGGMGGSTTTGGMGGTATTGGMGGGTTSGGMGGAMSNNPAPGFGTNNSGSSDNNAQPSYYTYQCAIPGGGCSIVAPAALRSSSFRPGARCSCSNGLSQGQIK
jgi:hypothetical protein